MNILHHERRLARFDLNLFRVFATVYREGSLTRAADRLALSQSAISHALSRMRDAIDDPLFVREGSGVVPTPLARRLWPSIRQGLEHLEQSLLHCEHFDPARDLNRVVLAMSDEMEPHLLPTFAERLRALVPALVIESVRIGRDTLTADLAAGRIDLAFDVFQRKVDGLNSQLHSSEKWVVVSSSPTPPTRDAYLKARHVVVSSRRTGRVVEDFELTRLGIARTIAGRCQQYESACRLVLESDWLLTVPISIAQGQAFLQAGLSLHPLPVTLPAISIHAFWHSERELEPASQWLRGVLLGDGLSRAQLPV